MEPGGIEPASVGSITNYSANNLNQYTSLATVYPTAGTVTPTHDNNGNLTYDGVFTYSYDSENRLTQISNGGTVATYQSDAQGRRKSKAVGATVTNYITDGANRVVLEYDGTSGAVQRWYAYGAGTSNVLNRMDVAALTRTTLVADIQGSIIGRLDASTASLTTAGYLPFGGNAADTASGLRYTAQQLDPETAGSSSQPSGLYYYRARSYSPAWGRFLQPDPIGYAGGRNMYAYVDNDPLNLVDPSGYAAASALSAARPTLNAIDAVDRNAAVISISTGMAIDLALAGPTGEGIPIAGAAFLGIKGLGAAGRGVRAGLVSRAQDWTWSSTMALVAGHDDKLLMAAPVLERYGDFSTFLSDGGDDISVITALRQSETTGRPLGSERWIVELEQQTSRKLRPQKRGPKKKIAANRAYPVNADTHFI